MQINLIYHDEDVLNGYLNIHPWTFEETEEPNVKIGNLLNLGTLVDDSEATEIIANKVIDYLSPAEIRPAMEEWIKKLRHGGKITIIGTDLYLVTKSILSFKLTSGEANEYLFGDQKEEYLIKRVALNCEGVANYLKEIDKDLEIEEKYHLPQNYQYVVTARRRP